MLARSVALGFVRRAVPTFSTGARAMGASIEREEMEFDVVVVGGGPSGLSTAIRLKQQRPDLSIFLVEKAGEIGGHILSGACIQSNSLEELFPDWKEMGAPLKQPVTEDHCKFLTETGSFKLPIIPWQENHGNYVVSLGEVCQWLAEQAEELEVEVCPGFPAKSLLVEGEGDEKRIAGIVTGDVGIDRDGKQKEGMFEPGMIIRAKQTILAEGCRGHLSKQAQELFNLNDGRDPQTYGIGFKEVWRIAEDKKDKHVPGSVTHTVGFPLGASIYGGTYEYHFGDGLISLGMVVGLDYENPHLSPYKEFQKWKMHPEVKELLSGGECISYGARALIEGGLQALPRFDFPGGALVGDSAGTMNLPKIKGTHTAMKSGILVADAIAEAHFPVDEDGEMIESEELEELASASSLSTPKVQEDFEGSWLHKELHTVRNCRPAFHYGLWAGMAYTGFASYISKGAEPFTMHHTIADHEHLKLAADCEPRVYPKPDGDVAFDILTSVSRSGTNHEEDQPVHLEVTDTDAPSKVSFPLYAGYEANFCPAGVYEYVEDKLVINAQNCVHCKTCDIKAPHINWTTPEAGGGPQYGGSM